MHCLICCSDLSSVNAIPNGQFYSSIEKGFQNLSCLDKPLHVVFVLSKVLQVPTEHLTGFLKVCPEIENWFQLCQECGEVIEKCKNAYKEMLDVIQKFKVLQEEIVQRVKSSGSADVKQRKTKGGCRKQGSVVLASRKFVLENKYDSFFDPFVVGDSNARRYLLTHSRSAVSDSDLTDSVPLIASISEPEALLADNWLGGSNFDDDSAESFEECVPEQKIVTSLQPRPPIEEEEEDSDEDENNSEEWTPQRHAALKLTGKRQRRCAVNKSTKVTEESDVQSGISRQKKSKAVKKFRCQTCGKRYSNSVSLQQHSLLHVNLKEMPFRCQVCGIGYPRSDYLSGHMRRKHAIAKVGVNMCPERGCKVSCDSSKLLEQHMMEHGGSPSFECETCGEEFYLQYALHRHQLYHKKGKKPPPKLPPRRKPRRTNKTKLKKYKGHFAKHTETVNQEKLYQSSSSSLSKFKSIKKNAVPSNYRVKNNKG